MKSLEMQQKVDQIIAICKQNRLLSDRFKALECAGYYASQRPMSTGGGIGNVKEMRDGTLRVRVSANWGGRNGNYAYCVQI